MPLYSDNVSEESLSSLIKPMDTLHDIPLEGHRTFWTAMIVHYTTLIENDDSEMSISWTLVLSAASLGLVFDPLFPKIMSSAPPSPAPVPAPSSTHDCPQLHPRHQHDFLDSNHPPHFAYSYGPPHLEQYSVFSRSLFDICSPPTREHC